MLKRLVIIALWYLSIGIAVGIEVGNHQVRRFDPGFDPTVSAFVSVFIWPVVLAADAVYFLTHIGVSAPAR